MTAIAAIAVPDAAATPVTKTFNPAKIVGDVAHYLEKTIANPVGWLRLALGLRDPVSNNGVRTYKQTGEFNFPITQTYTDTFGVSQTKLVRSYRLRWEWLIPEDGLLQERKDANKLASGIFLAQQNKDQVENLDHSWG